MFTLAAITVTCWLCALIALPHKPLLGNEIAELVYARLLGHQQCLVLLALLVTALTFLTVALTLPARSLPDVRDIHAAQRICIAPVEVSSLCYHQQPSGTWTIEELQRDTTWLVVGTVATPPALTHP